MNEWVREIDKLKIKLQHKQALLDKAVSIFSSLWPDLCPMHIDQEGDYEIPDSVCEDSICDDCWNRYLEWAVEKDKEIKEEQMSEEIAKYEVSQKVKPLTAKEIKADVQLIQEVMKAVMVEGHHYGIIPGTFKPTLYKPGSEKLLSTFRIAAYPKKIIDLSTQDEVRYQVEVHGICQTTGALLGVGIGECSSNEKKYKWRKPVCEQEFNETPEDKRQIAWQSGKTAYQVKQVRTNPSDVANTILKMAKKRAQIDMTLTVTAASDIFEQDLEDMPEELRETTATVNRKTEQKQEYQQPQSKSGQQTASTASNEKDLRAEITRMLTEMDSTGTEFEIMLKTFSGFEGKNKDTGEIKWIEGKIKVEELSDAAVKVTYGKIKKAYEKFLEGKINA